MMDDGTARGVAEVSPARSVALAEFNRIKYYSNKLIEQRRPDLKLTPDLMIEGDIEDERIERGGGEVRAAA